MPSIMVQEQPPLALNPSVPDAPNWRISDFDNWDCAKLRDRGSSWIVSRRRAAVFLSYIEDGISVQSHLVLQFKNISGISTGNFSIFRLWERIARDWEIKKLLKKCWNVGPEILYHKLKLFLHSSQDSMASQSYVTTSLSRKIVKFTALIFLNFESIYDFTDIPSSIYGKKIATRRLDTIHELPRSLSFAQSQSSKAKMRQFDASGNQRK